MKKVTIIGGGPSGLLCGIHLSRCLQGNSMVEVSIVEQKEKLGKKILATGNGRCNLTNSDLQAKYYNSNSNFLVETGFKKFGYLQTIDFFSSIGLQTKDKSGYIYPRNEQAFSVCHLLEREVRNLGISVSCNQRLISVKPREDGRFVLFLEDTERKERMKKITDVLVFATGGSAQSGLGSDGSGVALLEHLGHKKHPLIPALVSLIPKSHRLKSAKGVRTFARVSGFLQDRKVVEEVGELQITEKTISGIPIFQISGELSEGLLEGKSAKVVLDFLPEYSVKKWKEILQSFQKYSSYTGEDALLGYLPQKLLSSIFESAKVSGKKYTSRWKEEEICALNVASKSFELEIQETSGFQNAQVSRGGISTEEVEVESLESKHIPNLYILGEALDVDGLCGGYNLQWAWTSGYIAGEAIAKRLNMR